MDGLSLQEWIDRFYLENGPCCAGCDWWRPANSLVGECLQSKIISGTERAAAIGIYSCSQTIPAGHAVTRRDYHCGLFKDEFDWSQLPLTYRLRVGDPAARRR